MTHRIFKIVLLTACTGVAVVLNGCKGWPDQSNREAGIPRIRCQPVDFYVTNFPMDVELKVDVAGDQNEQLSYQWFTLEAVTGCTNLTDDLTAEKPVPGQTNNTLHFPQVNPTNYGLYFCEILNHPPVDRPPYGLVRETRTRLISLSGVAVPLILVIGTPPVEGSVIAGSGGNDSCIDSSSAYVTFPVSGSGYPANATTGYFQLKNKTTTNYYPTSAYKVMWTADRPVPANSQNYWGCCDSSRTNLNQYHFASMSGACYMFTVSFIGSPHPSTATKVIMELSFK